MIPLLGSVPVNLHLIRKSSLFQSIIAVYLIINQQKSMTNSNQSNSSQSKDVVKDSANENPGPFKSLSGAAIAATLATVAYGFTNLVTAKLNAAPLQTTNTFANRVATLVRTALLGLGSGATMIFSVIALGLTLLALREVLASLKLIGAKEEK